MEKSNDGSMASGLGRAIDIDVRQVYGNELYYVKSKHSHPIANLTGKATINLKDMEALVELGFTFNFTATLKNENVARFAEETANKVLRKGVA